MNLKNKVTISQMGHGERSEAKSNHQLTYTQLMVRQAHHVPLRRHKIFYLFFLIFLLSFSTQIFASPNTLQDQFNQANEAYFSRDFSTAIQLYTDLEKRGVVSGDLFYNLGNTYYRTGQIGRAIYYYTKALRYHPRDRDLVANDRYVESKRIDQIEGSLFSKICHTLFFWIDLTTLKELLIIAVIFYWMFFILLVCRILRKKFIFTLLLMVAIGLNLVILPTAIAKFYTERLSSTGVIISPVASVYSEPTQDAIKLFELHEGTFAQVTDREGSFKKIRLSDGKKGWVGEGDLGEVK
jgi:tetratricopeptide (TPR) repeat protein